MSNWKTTASAAVAAAAAFILFANTSFHVGFPQWALALATFATVGGLAGLGIAAKDAPSSSDASVDTTTVTHTVTPAPDPAPIPANVVPCGAINCAGGNTG